MTFERLIGEYFTMNISEYSSYVEYVLFYEDRSCITKSLFNRSNNLFNKNKSYLSNNNRIVIL